MSDSTLRVVANITSKPECIEETRAALMALIEPTRAENGCIQYELLKQCDAPAEFTFVETWESAAHLDAHLQTDHFKAAAEKLGNLAAGPPDIRTYSVLA